MKLGYRLKDHNLREALRIYTMDSWEGGSQVWPCLNSKYTNSTIRVIGCRIAVPHSHWSAVPTLLFIYMSQLLRDSFSVSQQPPIWKPPSHYSMIYATTWLTKILSVSIATAKEVFWPDWTGRCVASSVQLRLPRPRVQQQQEEECEQCDRQPHHVMINRNITTFLKRA